MPWRGSLLQAGESRVLLSGDTLYALPELGQFQIVRDFGILSARRRWVHRVHRRFPSIDGSAV